MDATIHDFKLELDAKIDSKTDKVRSEIEREIIIEKAPTINTYIDDFTSELGNSCTSNNNDIGDSQMEWDDEIIFDYDNIVPQEETIVSIAAYPNSYDIVPMDNNWIVTMQAREAESTYLNQIDNGMELTGVNTTFAVQELVSNSTKVGEEICFAVCADEQGQAVLEAVSEVSFKDTGETIRRVWDPGVCNSDGKDFSSI
jgi:hypothetical protein